MSLITEALREHGVEVEGEPGGVCMGSKFHSPTPLVVGVVDVAGQRLSLCSTCHANIEVFVSLMRATDGTLPWAVRREFGNKIRTLGMKSWQYTEGEPS